MEIGIEILLLIIGGLLSLFVLLGRLFWNRIFSAHDKLEERVLKLESSAVTHDDLQRLENKLDQMINRLDRVFERLSQR